MVWPFADVGHSGFVICKWKGQLGVGGLCFLARLHHTILFFFFFFSFIEGPHQLKLHFGWYDLSLYSLKRWGHSQQLISLFKPVITYTCIWPSCVVCCFSFPPVVIIPPVFLLSTPALPFPSSCVFSTPSPLSLFPVFRLSPAAIFFFLFSFLIATCYCASWVFGFVPFPPCLSCVYLSLGPSLFLNCHTSSFLAAHCIYMSSFCKKNIVHAQEITHPLLWVQRFRDMNWLLVFKIKVASTSICGPGIDINVINWMMARCQSY